MDQRNDTLVIIPARNEGARLPAVLEAIRRNAPDCDILVVEDGSTDDTVAAAREGGARVVSLPINLGYGGAIRVGFRYALSKAYECAVTMDADGQHDAADLPTVIRAVRDDGRDLVVGSRFAGHAHYDIPLVRRIGMGLFSMITSAVVGKRITDTTCGFMGVGPKALPIVAEHCATDFPNAELICIVARRDCAVGEVPVHVHERNDGESMFTFWTAVYYPFKLLLAISMVLLRNER